MIIRRRAHYDADYCRAHPDRLVVFGDNLAGWGKQGQACIRDEPNAVGLPTKYYPTSSAYSYFSNRTLHDAIFQGAVERFIRCVNDHLYAGRDVVVPVEIGTGLADLPRRAPKVHKFLIDLIASLELVHGSREGD